MQYTKLRIWDDFEKLCYLDADTIALKNRDHLFDMVETPEQIAGEMLERLVRVSFICSNFCCWNLSSRLVINLKGLAEFLPSQMKSITCSF
jgi:alpha-N-acetylglucosamine transferase